MDKFSKLKIKDEFKEGKEKILYKNNVFKIIEYENWSIISEKDLIICVPYLIESNQIILRHEYIPTFKYADGQDYHVTVISGGIEQGETKERSLLREIEEEAGIVIREDLRLEFLKPLFMNKGTSNKYYPCILPLTERDYHEIKPSTDGSREEKLSKCVKVDIKYLNSINSSDLITDYMIEKVKNYLNIN